MAFDWPSWKTRVRRTVHATFGVPAFYKDASVDAPVEIRARWHNRLNLLNGDLNDAGYAEQIVGIDRIVLIPEDTDGNPVALQRGGKITLDMMPGYTFTLDHKEPTKGPLEEAWAVTVSCP